jgi:hypothetical protein
MTKASGATSFADAKLSIVISTFNYADFLPASVESALAVDWPDKEIIVVDNGSTDNTRQVMEGFGDRIIPLFKEHDGQYTGVNTGFARSTGDVIIFLDSDDLLAPSILREVSRHWTSETTKAQVLMQTIDGDGKLLPSIFPQLGAAPSPDDIRKWQRATGFYPTPPASGNIYSRRLLEQIFPLKDEGTPFSDSYCISAAPLFGDVVTVVQPLCFYRVHGRNDGAMSGLDAERIRRDLERGLAMFSYTQRRAAQRDVTMSSSAPWNSLWLLPYRVASWKLDPAAHPVAGENMFRILADSIKACFTPQGHGRTRLALVVWSSAAAVLPRSLARHLLLWRFAPQSRPRFLREAMQRLGVLQRERRMSSG